MKVSDIMSHRVVTATPKTSYKEMWSLFFNHHINAIPVTNDKKELVGIVSKEDLLKRLYPNYLELVDDFSKASDYDEMEEKVKELAGVSVSEFMNQHVIFTRAETPIMRALSRMIAQRLDQLPVLTENNVIAGMITKGDVFKGLFREKVKKMKVQKQERLLIHV